MKCILISKKIYLIITFMFCYIFAISAIDFNIFEIVAPAEAFSLCSAKIKPKKSRKI